MDEEQRRIAEELKEIDKLFPDTRIKDSLDAIMEFLDTPIQNKYDQLGELLKARGWDESATTDLCDALMLVAILSIGAVFGAVTSKVIGTIWRRL